MPIEKESALEKELRQFNEPIQVVENDEFWKANYCMHHRYQNLIATFRQLEACPQSDLQVETSFSKLSDVQLQVNTS